MISILLATHNGEKYLRNSIESILNQTFINFELLIGLNGTTDGSLDIINSFNDERISTFHYQFSSKSKTLNLLIKESKYDWIGIQDDDDVWINNKIESQLRYIDRYDVIGTFIKYINESGTIIGGPHLSTEDNLIKSLSLSGNNQIANTSAIFRRSIASDIGYWREDIDGIEDFDFWLRLIRNNNKFINIPYYLVLHRLHSNSNFNTKTHDISKIL